MKKGISPLIAVVLLIAATVAVAAILANWATSYSKIHTEEISSKTGCTMGLVYFLSNEYPKLVGDRIVAVLEVENVPLGDFAFEVIYEKDGIEKTAVLKDTLNTSIAPGRAGSIVSENLTEYGIDPSSIKKVRIITNCSEVKTEWVAIK